MGADWAADCAMQWFDIFGSIDYNYTFFLIECTAAHNRWNRKEMYILSLLKQETIALFLTGTFLQPILPPIPVLPPPPQTKKYGMTV